MSMIRDIKIKAVLNGFIVECGCQTIVFNNIDELTVELNRYLNSPDKVEKYWMSNSINSKHTSPSIPESGRPSCETPVCEPRESEEIGRFPNNRR